MSSEPRANGCEQAEDNPRDRRVDASPQHAGPDDRARRDVGERETHANPPDHDHEGDPARARAARAATSSTMPLAAWMERKRSMGLTMFPARRRAGSDTSGGTGGREERRVGGSGGSGLGFENTRAAG